MGLVQRIMGETMTVAQLKRELQELDDDAPVFFTCDYGDRVHTQQALPIMNVRTHDSDTLDESAYSNSGVRFTEDDGRELDDGEEVRDVVIMSQDF